MQTKKDPKNGRFLRKHHEWSPKNYDDGWIHSTQKRYFVIVSNHPKASKTGYIKRALAMWEFHNGPLKKGLIIHHKNNNKLDDRIENLEALSKKDHDEHHRLEQRKGFYRKCEVCNSDFYISKWRLKDGRPGKFCPKRSCVVKGSWKTRRLAG